jgi:hypothetical protein
LSLNWSKKTGKLLPRHSRQKKNRWKQINLRWGVLP